MRPTVVLAVVAAVAASGCGGTKTVTRTVTVTREASAGPRQLVLYGHIESLARRRGRFELRFDPAWFLGGVAAEQAAVEDGVLPQGEPVPNDYYVVEEGHRLLTFVVSPAAKVTLVGIRLRPLRVPVSELEQIVGGKNPRHRKLFDRANHFGYWIRVGVKYPNPVVALEQQYQP